VLKAAIYARKSTDDSDRSEDNKSVTRQVEHARRYAEAKGWAVDPAHVYVDDGVSGAEFRNRPGLLRMLNNLKAFDVIVMSELSRLGRDMVHTTYALDNIKSHGVRVFFYLTDEEIKFDSAMDRFMLSAVSLAAELEREKASHRSRDALLRKAEKGYCTGGRVFGYDNVPIYHPNQKGERVKSHTEYRINEREADTVRRIFRMYAAGYGHTTIAKTLNGDPRYREPSKEFFDGASRASPRERTGSWAPSSVRKILYNAR
jgi:site-specific DNA recombinase